MTEGAQRQDAGSDTPARRDRWVSAILLLSALALWWLYREFATTGRTLEERPRQLALFFSAFLIFSICTLAVWRARPAASRRWTLLILAAGLLFRLTVAPARPATSSDLYRYLWEGRVVRAGMNPYLHPPGSPELAPLRNWVWPLVQHKSVPAAYPPVAQYVFALAGFIPLSPVTALKLALALFDALALLLLADLLRRLGRPPSWTIAYAWHPLAVCEVVARGHLDAIGLFFLVLAARLLLVPSRAGRIASGGVLALSLLSKGCALFLTPFFLMAAKPHRRAFALSLTAAAFLLYLPFLPAGKDLFAGLAAYAGRWSGNAGIFALVKLALSPLSPDPDRLARIICLALLAAWIGHLLRVGRRAQTPEAALLLSQRALMGFFLLAPTVYPWYLAWTLPFLCLDRSLPWLALTGAIFAFYAHDFAGHHREIWWVTSLEYALPLALAIGFPRWQPTPSPSSTPPP